MKLQKVMFLAIHGEGEDRYIQASELPFNAIEDDGPTLVATYKLVGKRRLSKVVSMVEEPKPSKAAKA